MRTPAALFLPLVALVAAGSVSAETVDVEPLEYVVVLKPSPGALARAEQLGHAHGARHVYRAVFPGFAARLSPAALAALQRNPEVDRIDPAFAVQAFEETLPPGVDRIDAERAHALGKLGAGARVAVVDTGVDLDHPDLAANVDVGLSASFISKGRTTVDGDDDQGHGTHVAGTIAAVANTEGVIGVAPGATLVSLKVLNNRGSGTSTDIIAALDFITAHNNAAASYDAMIHVANFSLGGSGGDTDSSYRRAFDASVASGCVIVVAAGNESSDAATSVPAAYDSVITVSAIDDATGSFAYFSNFGADVDIAAPGVNVLSTMLGGGYGTKNGTSMATPHVAGGAALYVADHMLELTKDTAVALVRAALVGAGEPVVMAGDPDGIHEPLLDAEALFVAPEPPAPAVNVSLASDKGTYAAEDTTAVVTAIVTDEYGAGIASLTAADFTATGGAVLVGNAGDGSYAFDVDISALLVGDSLDVTITAASGELSGSATITLAKSAAQVIFVSSIGYRNSKRDLLIDVAVGDTAGQPVAGASVSITLFRNGASVGSATAATDSLGAVSFRLRNASSGTYNTSIDGVALEGAIYDAGLNAADPGFTR